MLGAKPIPLAVTNVPTGPVVTEREKLRTMVYVTLSQFPLESTASMLQAPAEIYGTLKEQIKPPKGLVVTDGGFVVTGVPSKRNVTVAVAAKPTPVIVRTDPAGPLVEEAEMSGTTLKVAFAEAPATSVADIMFTPTGVGGRVNT